MNRLYKTVFNRRLGLYQVVSEWASSPSRSASVRRALPVLTLVMALGSPSALWAASLPENGEVIHGSASINQADLNVLNIDQHSTKAIINWESFNIGSGKTVNFNQTSSSAIALNRVLGNDPSSIYGNLNATGQVFLINQNGVLFAEGANVNVGGLVASTLDISNNDFLNGNYHFSGQNAAGVFNHGNITAGAVALLGGQVSNQGIIQANLGSVALAAGEQITLDFAGDGLINVTIDKGQLDALVENHGAIHADGGSVLLTTHAADELLNSVVNNTGIITAHTVQQREGKIILLADMQSGTANIDGTLDASAPAHLNPGSGNGGFIETSAATVQIEDSVNVTTWSASGQTGTWLIDPTDFTIYSGTGNKTDSGIGATTLENNLDNNNVILETVSTGSEAGDIHVNAEVSWNANTLTLRAHNNININAMMSASGSAGLALEYGQGRVASGNSANYYINAPVNLASTGSFSTKLGSNGNTINYTIITSLGAAGSTTGTDLQGINGDRTGYYVLGANIDASATVNWNSGAGFNPIGDNSTNRFTGTFDGLGHTINDLNINRPLTSYVGLFGVIDTGSVIRNVGLEGGSVLGDNFVGGLVGYQQGGSISRAYTTGVVQAIYSDAGGLVGSQRGGSINQAYATGAVQGNRQVAGLVGALIGGAISRAYATGAVQGNEVVGGLVGYQEGGSISQAYATGAVQGDKWVGGLVSAQTGGSISESYATGAVQGNDWVGGLVGYQYAGTVSQAYATGEVQGVEYVGGLVSYQRAGTVSQAYATGEVQGVAYVGGLVGWQDVGYGASVSHSYWATDATGQTSGVGADSATGVVGLTTAQMFDATEFEGFEFGTVWGNGGDQTTPYLLGLSGNQVFNKNDVPTGTVSPTNRPSLYTAILNADQLQAMNADLSGRYLLGNNIDASGTVNWNSGAGFNPIGDNSNRFSGTFDGLGHTINGLTINRPSTAYVGLFGVAGTGSVIRNIGLEGGSVLGLSLVGGLVGVQERGSISQSYATGAVEGEDYVGGLVGLQDGGSISESYAAGAVQGENRVGGLVGYQSSSGSISQSYAAGAVQGNNFVGGLVGLQLGSISQSYATGAVQGNNSSVGGLVGWQDSGSISESYATGAVLGENRVGGLVGFRTGGSISQSYATGAVQGSGGVGGLAGYQDGGSISESYAAGAVLGDYYVGGLVGYQFAGNISQSYATGAVQGDDSVGGLVGFQRGGGGGSVSDSYWNKETTGQDTSSGSDDDAGKTSAEMQQLATFAGWDISPNGVEATAWRIYEGHTAPLLRHFLTALTVEIDNDTTVYDGTVQTGSGSVQGIYDPALLLGGVIGGGRNAGNHALTSGFYSSQQGYDLTVAEGTLTITPRAITVSADDVNKVYGDPDQALTWDLVTGNLVGSDVLGGSLVRDPGENAGDYNINVGSLHNTNYDISFEAGTFTITPRAITVSADDLDKVYGEPDQALTWNLTNGNLVGSDVLDGSLLRELGEDVASYNIGVGSLSNTNYDISFEAGTFTITPRAITLLADVISKIYGTTDPTLSVRVGSGTSLASGDALSDVTGALSRDAGNDVGQYNLLLGSGVKAGNYTIHFDTDNQAFSITSASLVLSAVSDNRAYDGSLVSDVAVKIEGLVDGDAIDGLRQAFDSRHAGQRTLNVVDGFVVNDGNGGNNYIVTTHTAAGEITHRVLAGHIAALNKIYDGTDSVTLESSLTGVLEGEEVTLQVSGLFDNAEPGDHKTVLLNTVLSGSDASNYVLDAPASVTASIEGYIPFTGYQDTLASQQQSPDAPPWQNPALPALDGVTLVVEIGADALSISAVLPEEWSPEQMMVSEAERHQAALLTLLPAPGSVLFPTNSVSIEDEEGVRRLLAAVVEFLQAHPEVQVQLVGHADHTGPERFNRALSERRAQAVASLLEGLGVTAQQIRIAAAGSDEPLQEGADRDALATNRRVDFSLP